MPICRALSAHGIKIAPRTYWARARRPPSRRALADARITEILAGIYEPDARGRRKPESLYGSLKMWEHLNRQGIPVARCTVERLMAASRWRGVTRARTVRTTTPDPAHSRAPDLVKRDFKAQRPGQLHVADFTYVPLDGGGFGYTALVIDAFAGLIAGWECSLSKQTAFVERAIRQAAALRARQGHPISGAAIHHSDAGSQYTSLRFAQTLHARRAQRLGRVGRGRLRQRPGGNDNRAVQDRMCPRPGSPFRNGPIRTLAGLEEITSAWVHWYNTERLMHRLGRKPPAEAEAGYWARQEHVA